MPHGQRFKHIATVCRDSGLKVTIRKAARRLGEVLFGSDRILVYADLSEVDESVLTLPRRVSIEAVGGVSDIAGDGMSVLTDYWRREDMTEKVADRFDKGATLWILRFDGNVAGFVWSSKGKTPSPWYLPLTPRDVYFFDAVTFEQYRGQGLYPILMDYTLGMHKQQGISRALGELYTWNVASMRGLQKTHYRALALARKIRFLRRNVTIWSQLPR